MAPGARTMGSGLRAPVLEVFASIQGEGAFVGQPQVFLRLFGCPLRCRWCDTPGSLELPREPRARVEAAGLSTREPGLASAFQVATWIARADPERATLRGDERPRPLSITGGEPLEWTDFLLELATLLGPRPLHLETAAPDPDELARLLPIVDHVSLDLKLPEDLAPPVPLGRPPATARNGATAPPADPEAWAEVRERDLEFVSELDAAVKIVVAGNRPARAFVPLLDDAAAFAPRLPVYLQPVSPVAGVPAPSRRLLEEVVELARERVADVRVVPQVHRALGLP